MAGRYEKVFSLPENLYATGSPVIIAAGALQKDTHTGKIFAQLKLQSISSGIIKAAAIQISLFDTASRSLSNQIEYQYLDVEIIYGQTFGEKILIPVEDNTARSFSVAVTEVIFSHQRIWKASDEPWETLPVPAQLEPMLDDPELLKQYQLRFSKRHIYKFIETKDLWCCPCGAWNHKSNEKCLNCGIPYTDLASLDWEELKAEKDIRLVQENEERAQKETEKKKEREKKRVLQRKKWILFSILTLIAIGCSIVIYTISLPSEEEQFASLYSGTYIRYTDDDHEDKYYLYIYDDASFEIWHHYKMKDLLGLPMEGDLLLQIGTCEYHTKYGRVQPICISKYCRGLSELAYYFEKNGMADLSNEIHDQIQSATDFFAIDFKSFTEFFSRHNLDPELMYYEYGIDAPYSIENPTFSLSDNRIKIVGYPRYDGEYIKEGE